ncbi:hypothetical protein BaRGS_00017611 [Batillaria attramentaria]|uniref:Uncharacterized protein n=1 Tax=Batillaria attramentaria TaxID=370345 RepID=A0ABD0KVC8_9CAEN
MARKHSLLRRLFRTQLTQLTYFLRNTLSPSAVISQERLVCIAKCEHPPGCQRLTRVCAKAGGDGRGSCWLGITCAELAGAAKQPFCTTACCKICTGPSGLACDHADLYVCTKQYCFAVSGK